MTPHDPHGPIRGDRAYLINAAENQTYAIAHAPFRIGRDPSNHLQVLDTEISRSHAEVRFEDGKHVIQSLGVGDTLLNGQRVLDREELKEGDTVTVGEISLLYTKRSASGAIITEAGWAEDIRLSQAPTQRGKKFEPGSTSRDNPRTAMIIVVAATILLVVWALVSLMMR